MSPSRGAATSHVPAPCGDNGPSSARPHFPAWEKNRCAKEPPGEAGGTWHIPVKQNSMSKVSAVIWAGRGGDGMGEDLESSRRAPGQGGGKTLIPVLTEKFRAHSLTAEIHKQIRTTPSWEYCPCCAMGRQCLQRRALPGSVPAPGTNVWHHSLQVGTNSSQNTNTGGGSSHHLCGR